MKSKPSTPPSDLELRAILMNPFYAITLYPGLFGDHVPMQMEDDWVRANVRLLDEMGSEVAPGSA